MRELTDYQKKCLEVVSKHTKNNPVTGKEIANAIGLKPRATGKDGADMRSVVNALRVKGYPICAIGEGYYYAQTSSELSEYIYSFQGRIDKQQEACDGLKGSHDLVGRVFNFDPDQPIIQLSKTEWSVKHNQKDKKRYKVWYVQGSMLQCECNDFRFSNKNVCKGVEMVKAEIKQTEKEEIERKQGKMF